jgi:bifunctional non-homologous end joining protein LigD
MAQPFIRLAGRRIDLTQVDQTLFPEGITKQEIITYDRTIARVMLRHIHDRPLTLQRFPDGVGGKERLLSTRPTHFPHWMPGATVKAGGEETTYITASSPADLVYLANQGMVSLSMGLSRVDRLDHPDRMLFDLDPMDSHFSKVTQAVNRLRRYLESLGLTSFVQTTGSRGLHLAVPIKRTASFDEVRAFAETVAGDMAAMYPDVLTTDASGRNRERVYINCARNAAGQYVIVPYALRGLPGAPVATPLDWKELSNTDLSPEKYDIRSILRRLAQKSDPWEGMNRRASSLQKARERISSVQSGAA